MNAKATAANGQADAATPIEAAELIRQEQESFERYRNPATVLTRIRGRLEEVSAIGKHDALLSIRDIEGMQEYMIATAQLQKPREEIDEVLKKTGRYGPITLIGMATGATDGLAKLRMDEVHSINGIDVRRQAA